MVAESELKSSNSTDLILESLAMSSRTTMACPSDAAVGDSFGSILSFSSFGGVESTVEDFGGLPRPRFTGGAEADPLKTNFVIEIISFTYYLYYISPV